MTRQQEIEAQLKTLATLHAKYFRIKILGKKYSQEQIHASLRCHRIEKRERRLLNELGIDVPDIGRYTIEKA